MKHLYTNCFKVFENSNIFVTLALGTVDLSFLMTVQIFLVYCMASKFSLYPGQFENYVIRLWVLFKYYRKCSHFCLSRQLTWFSSSHTPWLAFCGLWFQCHFCYQSSCCAIWIGPACVSSGWLVWDLGSDLPCYSVLKISGIPFRVRFMHAQFVVSQRSHKKTLQVTFLHDSSIISLIF